VSGPSKRQRTVGKYVEAGLRYCEDVLDGTIPACKWVKRACERAYAEFYEPPEGLYFDCDAANAICAFIEGLPHIKGEWARRQELIQLEGWQCFVLIVPFGWMRDDGTRRFRTVYIEVPRKNAKSTLSAGVALYLFARDREPGAEVYSVATKREQARIVFDIARLMALRTSLPSVTVFRHNLHVLDTASLMQPLAAESSSLDGLNISGAVNDELHAWKKPELYDVIETATGSRLQPLIWNITTAGTNIGGICWNTRAYVTKILDGVIDDDTYFGCIWSIDDEDDWTSEATWKKANPNYGVSVYPMDLQSLAKKAAEVTSQQTAFLTKRLNVWCSAAQSWMNMQRWQKCGNGAFDLEDFRGQECYIGVDLASKNDIASVALLFPREIDGKRHWYSFVRHYLPEVAVRESANTSLYDGWVRSGFIRVTGGSVLDVDRIEAETLEIAEQYDLREVAFDPGHNSTQYGVHMDKEGLQVVEVRPTVLNFSEPMKWFEAWVSEGTWHHNADPVMTWMVSNVVFKPDFKDNIYPRKQNFDAKIDGVVATLMAINRAVAGDDEKVFDGDLAWV